VANYIGKQLDDEVVNLFEHIKNYNYSRMTSDRPWVFVAPTYAWQLPHIVRDWIIRTELSGNANVYFVMTCGDAIGNAGHYTELLCKAKNLIYMGCAEIVMPENYIAIYEAPEEEKAEQIILNAEKRIRETAELIKLAVRIPDKGIGVRDIIKSGLVNAIFYPCIVSAKKFYALDQCISCGHCERVCPLSNIVIMHGKPSWGKNCTHCMACICTCPKEAIEYGKASQGKRRYTCKSR
jgi:ferredoxin